VKRSLLILTVLVAGCTHQREVEIREVPVPTPVTCVDPAAIPQEPPRVAQRFNGNARHDLEILAKNAQDLRSWGQEMRALLDLCVDQAPPAAAAP
jgi:hypothetical protein